MINAILIVLALSLIAWIIYNARNSDSWFEGFLDALLISDLIDVIGKLLDSGKDWVGSGGGFSGGGSSGSFDFDFDLDD